MPGDADETYPSDSSRKRVLASGAFAEVEDPFADAVERRHGLMLHMATGLGKVGAMTMEEAPHDTAVAGKAAATAPAGLQFGMADIGSACGACHKVYRQPEE